MNSKTVLTILSILSLIAGAIFLSKANYLALFFAVMVALFFAACLKFELTND